MIFRAGPAQIRFPRPTLMMGIVNVTPDSFSDGGQFLDAAAAVAHAMELDREGADILDIGGESTRPRATPVTEGEELRRVIPVIEALAGRVKALISIDTYKPGVAREALRAGAVVVNDVGANREEGGMWRLIADTGAGYVAMHMQGTPQTMQLNPVYADVRGEVAAFFEDRLQRLSLAGVNLDQVALDVGIGFGKTAEHNLELIAGLAGMSRLGRPLLLGVSRKSFLGRWSGAAAPGRLPAALACTCWAVSAGVQMIRTHDVAQTLQAVRMTEALVTAQGGSK